MDIIGLLFSAVVNFLEVFFPPKTNKLQGSVLFGSPFSVFTALLFSLKHEKWLLDVVVTNILESQGYMREITGHFEPLVLMHQEVFKQNFSPEETRIQVTKLETSRRLDDVLRSYWGVNADKSMYFSAGKRIHDCAPLTSLVTVMEKSLFVDSVEHNIDNGTATRIIAFACIGRNNHLFYVPVLTLVKNPRRTQLESRDVYEWSLSWVIVQKLSDFITGPNDHTLVLNDSVWETLPQC